MILSEISFGFCCENLINLFGLNRVIPTAIIGVNDLIAIGALMNIYERGLSIPNDIAIAGYDNIPLAQTVYPPLTTVREPIHEKAKVAIDLLLRKIVNRRVKNKDIKFETELIIRDSA